MPVLQNADLSSVDTSFKPYPERPEGYVVRVKESQFHKDGAQLRIISEIEEPEEYKGRPFTHFINVRQNDGSANKYGLADVKRYMEAVFGKGSQEAENANPDTDVLNGSTVRLYLFEDSYKDKSGNDVPSQGVKKILPV